MRVDTSGAAKFFFPSSSLSQVYMEAIANSLDAGASEISIRIRIKSYAEPDSLTITVEDNGGGFTADRFDRFCTLLRPQDEFHKGLGRLVYLQYFEYVDIESEYAGGSRRFTFSRDFDGGSTPQASTGRPYTKVHLRGFSGKAIKSYEYLRPYDLKRLILRQFLPTFVQLKLNGQEFRVAIAINVEKPDAQKSFVSDDDEILPADVPPLQREQIQVSGLGLLNDVEVSYSIRKGGPQASVLTALNVDGRTIEMDLIDVASVPAEYDVFFLISSSMLTFRADSARQRIVPPDGVDLAKFKRMLRSRLGEILERSIPQIRDLNAKVQGDLDARYPHLRGYFEGHAVGLVNRDESLRAAQERFFLDQRSILDSDSLDENLYQKSLDVAARTLAEYVLYRAKIIDRLKAVCQGNDESALHDLLVPRKLDMTRPADASQMFINNAWLLDERFMAFRRILSDREMSTVLDAVNGTEGAQGERGRPDIVVIFDGSPESASSVDVVVVELKRPEAGEKENQLAINQLLERARKLVAYCPRIGRMWYYAIVDIDSDFAESLEQQRWIRLFSSGHAYYYEHETKAVDGRRVPTPTFVVSLQAVIADAERRNSTFLDVLKSAIQATVGEVNSGGASSA